MDFDSLDLATASEKPFELELKHPQTSNGLGVFVSVIGSESNTFQTYLRREANAARLRNFERTRKGDGDKPMTVEEEEKAMVGALAVCLTGWRTVKDGKSVPTVTWGGKEYEFTQEAAVEWLRKFKWVRGQINEATGDLANFIKD